jgi:hypothetical protein
VFAGFFVFNLLTSTPRKTHKLPQNWRSYPAYSLNLLTTGIWYRIFNRPIGKGFRAISAEFVMEFVLVSFGFFWSPKRTFYTVKFINTLIVNWKPRFSTLHPIFVAKPISA